MWFLSERCYLRLTSAGRLRLNIVTDDQFAGLLVQVLDLDGPHLFSQETLVEDLPNLDSLRFMKLVSAIEAEAGVVLTPEQLMDVETVGDLRALFAGSERAAI